MNTLALVILYHLNLWTTQDGRERVARNNLASLLNCTGVTAHKKVVETLDVSYYKIVKYPTMGRGHGYRYEYHITPDGVDALHDSWQKAFALHRDHQQAVYHAKLDKMARVSLPRGKAIKRSDKQLPLFGDE